MTDFANWRLGSGLWVPATPALQNHTVDANNDGIAFEFQARDTNPITHIGFRYGARTGTPPTFVATVEGKSASTGAPDGADVGGGSPTAKTFTPPADATWDGTWQWIALTNSYTPSRGQILMVTIRYSSGTIDASNLSTFTSHVSSIGGSGGRFPLAWRLTAGSWASQSGMPLGAARTASTRYGCPAENLWSTRSASTVGHRQAAQFSLPSAIASTKLVKGVRLVGSIANASGKVPILGLWNSGGVLQNVTLDSDWWSTNTYGSIDLLFDEATLSTLSFGTTYYVGFQVADAVNGGVLVNGLQLDDSADRNAYAGGSDVCLASFDGSSWTSDTTVYPFFELILDDITGNSGGGGVVIGNNGRVIGSAA